jgi:NTE family protein
MGGTALVLGGGGPVGGAWMTGVLAGLADAGVDPVRADVVIGTSAGAIFGARLASGEPVRELYERQLTGADRLLMSVTAAQTVRFLWAALGSRDPERSVRRLGWAALAVESGADVVPLVRSGLRGVESWPGRGLRIAAVDAHTGVVEALDRDAKVSLVEAVAASCAVPLVFPPVSAGGRRWMDGGSRSTANLQLARGCERVLAVAPIDKAVGPHPSAERQAAELVAEGVAVSLLVPDAASRRAMGRDLTSDAHRVGAALAGRAQAGRVVEAVGGEWQG